MRNLLIATVIFLMTSMTGAPAEASQPRLLSVDGAWSSYVFREDGGKVCYMAAKPSKSVGNYSRRGEIFTLITHRPKEGTSNVFSYITGYTYKPGSDVTVDIDGKIFVLFTQDDTAWAPDAETDERLAEAIRKGNRMTVSGISSRGTKTKDTFSLKGSGKAHDRINKECR